MEGLYPEGCECRQGTTLFCRNMNLSRIPKNLPFNLTKLLLHGNLIENLTEDAFIDFPGLVSLVLDRNPLKRLPNYVFKGNPLLTNIHILDSKLEGIEEAAFWGLNSSISFLFLDGNSLTDSALSSLRHFRHIFMLDLARNEIELRHVSFPDISSVGNLYLSFNRIEQIREDTFASVNITNYLTLRGNRIQTMEENAFGRQNSLGVLDLSANKIRHLSSGVFSGLISLRELEFQSFHYCSYTPSVKHCHPNSDGENLVRNPFRISLRRGAAILCGSRTEIHRAKVEIGRNVAGISSTESLLGPWFLRVWVWTMAFLTCLGNGLVIWGRMKIKADNNIVTFSIKNLAAADFLMGLYLFVIGGVDFTLPGRYNSYSLVWRSSGMCSLAGALAMLSTQVSVLVLAFLSLDRVLVVGVAFPSYQLDMKHARTILAAIWLLGFALALFPVFAWNVVEYYGAGSGMCFPLHITDPYMKGWEYSAIVFFGINLLSLLVIVVSYSWMWMAIFRTRKNVDMGLRASNDWVFLVRFFLVVATDCLCWIPVIILKIVSILLVHIPESVVSPILVVFLPLNSALNPLIYTFSSLPFRKYAERNLIMPLKRYTSSFSFFAVLTPAIPTRSGVSDESKIDL
ncbi:unnamed protein product [Darwinula stevensoni]|uniref:G-protein coupled receptors family 1 profile domain-containing protein n=1 Tax=Darwinula stevensoni TaxID=69355 RepID=A0A7R8X5A4_9CRUS|nr:unnamed protein product [Darwinula stevensoni]CAG0880697.1 unnamed protein product [Darwinula stevensoni]